VSTNPENPELWLDAHLSQYLPPWIQTTFGIKCRHVLGLGLREAKDPRIFAASRSAGIILLTKDPDFVELVRRQGPPPQVILLTCGNRSNDALKVILGRGLPLALARSFAGEPIVELLGGE
jgi:predicted nuclease of predicted toxin-antitoxin system